MTLSDDQAKRARAAFDVLIELPRAARFPGLMDQVAAGNVDAVMEERIAAWLRAADTGRSEEMSSAMVNDEVLRAWYRQQSEHGAQSAQGQSHGAYTLLKLIGQGGMGRVYLAERNDGVINQKLAIKILQSDAAQNADFVRRFRTEREILAELKHPFIARMVDGGQWIGGAPFLAMEYIVGEELLHWCKRTDANIERRVQLMIDICSAVQAAHSALIVHRDLKPANILVGSDGKPKLLDFGIAKVLGEPNFRNTLAVTQEQSRLMTLRYASPEQADGAPVTAASDVYALGVILYELLCGISPYPGAGDSAASLIKAICFVEPQAPSSQATATDAQLLPGSRYRADLDAITLRALRKLPTDRYLSAGELGEDLQRCLDGRPVFARRGEAWYRVTKFLRRHRWPGLPVAALILLLGGALAWQWNHPDSAVSLPARATPVLLGFGIPIAEFGAISEQGQQGLQQALAMEANNQRAEALRLLEALHDSERNSAAPAWLRLFFAVGDGDAGTRRDWQSALETRLPNASSANSRLLASWLSVNMRSDWIRQSQEQELLDSLLALYPKAWRLRLARAHLALRRMQYGRAAADLSQVPIAELNPRLAISVLGDRAQLGDADAVEALLPKLGLASAVTRLIEGRIALSRGDWSTAERTLVLAGTEAEADSSNGALALAWVFAALAAGQNDNWQAANNYAQAARRLALVRSSASQGATAELLLGYTEHRLGKTLARDAAWGRAQTLLSKTDDAESQVRLELIRLRLGLAAQPVSDSALERLPPGGANLVRARQSWAQAAPPCNATDTVVDQRGARQALELAQSEGVADYFLADEAALLDADLARRVTPLTQPRLPYPFLSRWLSYWESQHSARCGRPQ